MLRKPNRYCTKKEPTRLYLPETDIKDYQRGYQAISVARTAFQFSFLPTKDKSGSPEIFALPTQTCTNNRTQVDCSVQAASAAARTVSHTGASTVSYPSHSKTLCETSETKKRRVWPTQHYLTSIMVQMNRESFRYQLLPTFWCMGE